MQDAPSDIFVDTQRSLHARATNFSSSSQKALSGRPMRRLLASGHAKTG
jgi:hypothetical protein